MKKYQTFEAWDADWDCVYDYMDPFPLYPAADYMVGETWPVVPWSDRANYIGNLVAAGCLDSGLR